MFERVEGDVRDVFKVTLVCVVEARDAVEAANKAVKGECKIVDVEASRQRW